MDDELVGVLRREQRLLELVLFRLVNVRHLLAAGDARFLVRASAEVRIALERVRETEMLRAALTERMSRSSGLGTATLRAVAESRPSPYGLIYDDLRAGLDAAFREAVEVAASVRALATAGLAGLERRSAPSIADHDGRLDAVKTRQGYEAALAATTGVSITSLAESLC